MVCNAQVGEDIEFKFSMRTTNGLAKKIPLCCERDKQTDKSYLIVT